MSQFDTVVQTLLAKQPSSQCAPEQLETCLKKLGSPHKKMPAIHVAGTNGKGAVTTKIAAALQLEGYKVGRFISPHLFAFVERIAIDGVPISEDAFIHYSTKVNLVSEKLGIYLNFFSQTTAIALLYFADSNVDIAVVEVGLGGERDSTIVVNAILSVITSVSLDHQEYFGNDINVIARVKAGIIRPSVPLVLGPHARNGAILDRAKDLSAPLYPVEETYPYYDLENSAIAQKALEAVAPQFPVDPESIQEGLQRTLPCHFELRGNAIFDVAHNPDGFARLCEALSFHYPNKQFRFVIGFSRGKDYGGCLKAIACKAASFHFVEAATGDGMDAEVLGFNAPTRPNILKTVHRNVASGMDKANELLQEGELIVVCGSFYIMAEAIAAIPEPVG